MQCQLYSCVNNLCRALYYNVIGMGKITKLQLIRLYNKDKLSSAQIAKKLKFSTSKVNYWMKRYEIKKRSISESIYTLRNPLGDPFLFKNPNTSNDWFLFGLGIGLYWGEGTKKSLSLRLGNSDPELIRKFIFFLRKIYSINLKRLRFGLQLFSDINENDAIKFWCSHLNIKKIQFYKTIFTVSNKKGTYKSKVKYGVLTLYFNNKKLRDHIMNQIEVLKTKW